MTVVHFILDPRTGGPHLYAKSIVSALRGRIKGLFVTAGKGAITDLALFNLRQRWSPLYLIEVPLNVALIVWCCLFGRIPARNVVFDVHGAANLAPIIAARLLSAPVVWHFHETLVRFKAFAAIGRFLLRGSDHRIVVVAEAVAECYRLKGYTLIHPAVDLDFWRRDSTAPTTRRDHIMVLIVANLNPLKGHDLLLEALKDWNRPVRLCIVGAELTNQWSYRQRLTDLCDEVGAVTPELTVEFVGWRERSVVRVLMAHCDLFVLPSRAEACPMSLLEAMAMECLCVATDVGGVREIIRSDAEAFLVPPDDPESLRNRLEKAVQMAPKDRYVVGKRARARIEQLFDLNRNALAHLELYLGLVG